MITSCVTDRSRQDQLLLCRSLARVLPIWLLHYSFSSSVGATCRSSLSLFRGKGGLSHRPRTPCDPPRHTAHCVERLRSVLKEYVSAGVHHDRDNAPAPICSMTQVDIWPEGTRGCLWGDPHAGAFLLHGNAQRDSSHNLGRFHLVHVCGDWHWCVLVSRPLPVTLSLVCYTLIATVTRTSAAAI